MYLRKTTKRHLKLAGLLLLALVVLMPKLDLSTAPRLAALFQAAGLEPSRAG